MKNVYIEAAIAALETGTPFPQFMSGLELTLQAKGHEKLKRSILRGLLLRLERKNKSLPTVTLAKGNDLKKWKNDIEDSLTALGTEETPIIVTDDTLIGGYVATSNHIRIDQSYKRKLLDIYERATKAAIEG